MALGCLCRSFGLALWIRRSAVYWQHATFAEVLACCRGLRVIVDNRHQVGPGTAVLNALGRQDGSGTAVSGALGHQVGPGMAVSDALSRQVGSGTVVSGTLGRLGRPQGRPRVQKRASNNARIDAAGRKIDAKWASKTRKNKLCLAAPSGYGLGMFFNRFLGFSRGQRTL